MTIITQYTKVLSQPGDTFRYRLIDLCDDCRATQLECSKMGRVYNARCELCGATDAPPPTPTPTQPNTEITYSRFTHDYSCYVNGQYVGSAPSYTDAEILIDRILIDRAAHRTMASNLIAGLAQQYRRAKSEGRLADAADIKKAAMVAKAASLGITYEVFAEEYSAVQAEQQAA